MILHAFKVAVGAVLLLVLQGALAFLVPPPPSPMRPAVAAALASALLTTAVLAGLAGRLRARGPRAAVVLWLVWGGIQVNSLAETLLFDLGIPRTVVARLAVYLVAVSGVFSALIAWAFARSSSPAAREEPAPP
ncbi:MAG TPA: hypothetical protein VFM29_08935, partial [Vicinamibacteria bacterium]|nr:hypothetical protein [Vicinamibacteria bacterium]